jgi:hypothetical protein
MARMKKNRTKRPTIAAPVVGAVGASMALAGGAYATGVIGSTSEASSANDMLGPQIYMSDEEIADVNLGTFFVFDRENLKTVGEQFAQRGCRGGAGRCAVAGCRGCGGCRGCAVGGCRSCRACAGCAGCSCGCCISWGACRFIC